MPNPRLSEHDDDPQPERGNRGLWLAVAIAAVMVVFVLLHLLGVLGPAAHSG